VQFYQYVANFKLSQKVHFLLVRKFDAIRVWRIIRLRYVYDFIVDWGRFFKKVSSFLKKEHFTSTSPMDEVLVRALRYRVS